MDDYTRLLDLAPTVKQAAVAEMGITIDRPKGFKKTFMTEAGPKERTYPLDYGYFNDYVNPEDNEGADVFVGSGGPHHGRFMKGKPGPSGFVPDERKWYLGLTDDEKKVLSNWWEQEHDKGLTWDWTDLKDYDGLMTDLAPLRAATTKVAECDSFPYDPSKLYVYTCPHCHSDNMLNGEFGENEHMTTFRGSGVCQQCDRTASIVGRDMKPVGKRSYDEWQAVEAGKGSNKSASYGSVITYVPRAALLSVKTKGLLSGSSLLSDTDALSTAAAARNTTPEEMAAEIQKILKGWKPDSAKGVNAVFANPPASLRLPRRHPARRFDTVPVSIDLDRLMTAEPGTRLHGQELMPYDDYISRWSEEQLKNNEDDVSLRHRDLTADEFKSFKAMSPSALWRHMSNKKTMYAANVPHLSVITPSGKIPPEYLNTQTANSPTAILVKRAEDSDMPFTICVDLDGTLAETITPHDPERIGAPREDLIEYVREFKEAGARIIVFTVRGNVDLVAEWLDSHDVPYDYINENPDQPDDSSGKIIADVYWDDRGFNAKDPHEHGSKILEMILDRSGDSEDEDEEESEEEEEYEED